MDVHGEVPPATPGPPRAGSAWSRVAAAVRSALSAVVRDREPGRRSSYLIRGSGDGKTRVVGGGHQGGGN